MFGSMTMVYWTGVVEDRHDPLFAGRVKVRVHGHHNADPAELPFKDLPWAMVLQPITSAAMTGVGSTPLGPVEGTTVVGFFADGEDAQQPIVLGTLAGIPIRMPPKKFGFRDPELTLDTRPLPAKPFPRELLLKEADTNRLARRQNIAKTIVQTKKDKRSTGVPVAFGGTWDQPTVPYNAEYPYNHVMESESGHIFEVDDTKGNERLHTYHRTGTFTEIDTNGTRVNRIVGDGFEIFERNSSVHIKGVCNITVDGSANLYVKNDCNLEVDGDFKAHAHGNMEFKAGKSLTMSAKEGMDLHSDDGFTINTDSTLKMKSKKAMTLGSTIKTTISSPVTEVALLKMNGMSISPIPPKPPTISAPSTTSSKSTSSPSFSTLTVPTTRPDVPIEPIVPMTEDAPIK